MVATLSICKPCFYRQEVHNPYFRITPSTVQVIQLRKSYKGSIGPDPMFLNCQSTSTRNGVATQNEFPQLEITNVAKQKTSTNTFQKSEIRNYHQNGVNLKNSHINSSLQDGVNNQELGRYYSLQKTPTLSSALKFHHKRTCISIKNNKEYSIFLKTNSKLHTIHCGDWSDKYTKSYNHTPGSRSTQVFLHKIGVARLNTALSKK